MEFHQNEANTAIRIFDKGLVEFWEDIEFVLTYLNFLISINNDARELVYTYLAFGFSLVTHVVSGAREVFERATITFPPDRARPLWEKWTRYEYQYGNFERVRKLEKRILDVYPNGRS
jgi:cleavage stimulation factor subunit 3